MKGITNVYNRYRMIDTSKTQLKADKLRVLNVEPEAQDKLSNREIIRYYGGKENARRNEG